MWVIKKQGPQFAAPLIMPDAQRMEAQFASAATGLRNCMLQVEFGG